jgi:hypothetical protein
MSFLRLHQTPGLFLLTAHGFAHKSPVFDHVLEVDCLLSVLTAKGYSNPTLRVPLTDFAMYPIGSTFGTLRGKRMRGAIRKRSRRSITILKENELWHLDRTIDVARSKIGGNFQAQLPSPHPVYMIEQSGGPQFGMLHAEPLRFLSSGVSLLLDTIAAATTIRPTSEELFMTARESGLDGRELVLTPHRQFQNMNATMQMALMFSDPNLLLYFTFVYRNIRRAIAAGQDGLLGHNYFPEPFDFTVETEKLVGQVHDGSRASIEICDRIVADHREPKFDELVIRVKRSKKDPQVEALQALEPPSGPEEPSEQPRVNNETRILKYPRPGTKTVRLSSLNSTFTQRFPGFKRIKVRFDYEFDPNQTHHPMPHKKFVKVDAPEASTGNPKPGGLLPRVVSGDIPEFDTTPFEPPVVDAHFLPVVTEACVQPVVVSINNLPYLMRNFLLAAYNLENSTAHELLPDIPCAPNEAMLFELPLEWDGFSALDKQGMPRMIAATPLRFDDGITWVIEILRRNSREQFAIGLCSPKDFDEPVSFLSRVMFAVSERVGKPRLQDVAGTWPRATYRDVKFDTVIHSAARWHARNLAEVLLARAHSLVAPELDI